MGLFDYPTVIKQPMDLGTIEVLLPVPCHAVEEIESRDVHHAGRVHLRHASGVPELHDLQPGGRAETL